MTMGLAGKPSPHYREAGAEFDKTSKGGKNAIYFEGRSSHPKPL